MNRALIHLCAHIGYIWPGEPPEDGEMIEMTLSSNHRIRNSSPGGLRPSTLLLGHGGSPHVDGEETFFVSFKPPRPGTDRYRIGGLYLRTPCQMLFMSKTSGKHECHRNYTTDHNSNTGLAYNDNLLNLIKYYVIQYKMYQQLNKDNITSLRAANSCERPP